MDFLSHSKWAALLLVLPLYACAPLQPHQTQADLPSLPVHEPRYAVARPHTNNDYPVSYRVKSVADGHTKAIDQHILAHQSLLLDSTLVK